VCVCGDMYSILVYMYLCMSVYMCNIRMYVYTVYIVMYVLTYTCVWVCVCVCVCVF
jgi:hypothetical protein